ncbi:MAG: ArsR/SmtB family transcription factor [Candidatus Hodarchaeales archaeon]|jgi:DNA-binding transcriptional ArsR family regulator
MTDPSDSPIKGNINHVLKALNHPVRRDILRYIERLGRALTFTEILSATDFNSQNSSQFSYHLKLLIQAQMIKKEENSYQLTPIGKRASSLLDIADEIEEPTKINQVARKIKNLTPSEQIFVSWYLIPGIIALISLVALVESSSNEFIFYILLILSIPLTLLFLGLLYRKLTSIYAIFITTNIIWVLFLEQHQKRIATINILSLLGVVMILLSLIEFRIELFTAGVIFITIAVVYSINHILKN